MSSEMLVGSLYTNREEEITDRWLFFSLFPTLGFGIQICKDTVVGRGMLVGYSCSGIDVGVCRYCRSGTWEFRHRPLQNNRSVPTMHDSLLVAW